ncbi:hypothetical protein GGI43DRAFT_7607 [Trichoderma evansii]
MYKAVALTSIAALAGQSMALNAHRHQHQMDKKALVVDWTTVVETVYVTVDPGASTPAAPAAPAATSASGGFAAQAVPNPAGNAAAASSSSVVVASSPAAPSTTLVTSVRPSVAAAAVVSSSIAPVVASSAPVSSAPAPPPTTSAAPTPTPTPSSSSAPAPPPSSTSQAAPSATPSKAPSSAPPVSAGHFGRGMAYNSGALANAFGALSKKITWGYNWGFYPDSLDSQYSYIPTLWSPAPSHSDGFAAQVETLIASGTKAIFSFNEPDIASQANMSPGDAASAYQQWLNQYSGRVALGAPAVSNSQSAGQGADWLKQFVEACDGNCKFDFCNMHWYSPASAIDTLFSQIEAVSEACNGLPVMITEFQASGSVAEVQAFLEEALPKLDGNSNVLGYSYFMVNNDGTATGADLMASDTSATEIGQTYAST